MFLNKKNADGHVAPFEQLPCSAITPKNGMAMVLSSGKLAIASGTNKPEFICIEQHSAAVSAGDLVTVVRVEPDTDYETVLSASGALNIGDKVTLASDGLRVTATTASGVAEIVAMEGTASGDTVIVRF
ncbi:MAG: hypothetical protein IKO00_03450 [Oscillospiraceae bacterium]|nr:hypothetical protein [Oscillospiraceae bacterium]